MPPQGREIFHSSESFLFFSFSFASKGKTDEGKEFTIAEKTVFKLSSPHFRLEDLIKCVSDRI